MELLLNRDALTLETLATVIARSQIVVATLVDPAARLPAGFDEIDVAVLDWIVAEGRRLGRNFVRM
jgi:hypothetical protein